MSPKQKSPEDLLPGTRTLGVSLALAAGASLPSKADAIIIVNETAASSVGASFDVINIQFNPIITTPGIIDVTTIPDTSTSNYTGWFLQDYGASFTFFQKPLADTINSIQHEVLQSGTDAPGAAMTFADPPPTLDLAAPGSGYYWGSGSTFFVPIPAQGTRFYLGLRSRNLDTADIYYGWAEFEIGSVNHIRTAFQSIPNASINIGQIPEPSSSALLLTSGLAGVTAFRRRRKK